MDVNVGAGAESWKKPFGLFVRRVLPRATPSGLAGVQGAESLAGSKGRSPW